MKKFLNQDNPIILFFAKLVDAVVLHFLWLVCCIPVVTIGPATTALYYVLMKDIRNEGSKYYRMFFTAFRENFRKGMGLGLIFPVVAGLLTGAGFMYVSLYEEFGIDFMRVMTYVSAVLILIWVMVFEYAFPLLARFDNTVLRTLKNAFFLMVSNLGWTIVMAALLVGFYALIILLFRFLFPLTVLGYGLVAYINSYILNRIFKPYVEKAEEEEKERTELPEGEDVP